VQVLLLEPDRWRYIGISEILQTQPDITLLGDPDYKKILALTAPPSHLRADVVIVSHALTLDSNLEILEHLHKLFPGAQLLVDGYDETLDGIADVLRAGAKGYFHLSSDPTYLLKALAIVQKGYVWAPRSVVSFLVGGGTSRTNSSVAAVEVSTEDVSILKMLQRGQRNKQIALALGVAEVTVKTHLTRLFRRFGVRTRLELLSYALSHGIISDQRSRAGRRAREI
jgi:DNA-binding NarL/FixJ family response regulator